MKATERAQPLALLVLRLVLGAIMIAHGYPKVFGGLHHTAEMMHGYHIPLWLSYISPFTEFGGGILILLGLVTRCAALAVLINMLVAIFVVHFRNGFTGQGNYQFPLALAAIAFSLIITGPGPIAVEWLFGGQPRH